MSLPAQTTNDHTLKEVAQAVSEAQTAVANIFADLEQRFGLAVVECRIFTSETIGSSRVRTYAQPQIILDRI